MSLAVNKPPREGVHPRHNGIAGLLWAGDGEDFRPPRTGMATRAVAHGGSRGRGAIAVARGHRGDFESEKAERFLRGVGNRPGRRPVRNGWQRSCPQLAASCPTRTDVRELQRFSLRVDRGSLIHADHNTYSVPSRLMGENVEVRL